MAHQTVIRNVSKVNSHSPCQPASSKPNRDKTMKLSSTQNYFSSYWKQFLQENYMKDGGRYHSYGPNKHTTWMTLDHNICVRMTIQHFSDSGTCPDDQTGYLTVMGLICPDGEQAYQPQNWLSLGALINVLLWNIHRKLEKARQIFHDALLPNML
jgi:hypothetical protein